MRPKSIIWFERLYLGAWLIGLINTVFNWNTLVERVTNQPGMGEAAGMIVPILYVSTAIGLLIPLLPWFFIARMGSEVAKWILVVLFAIGALFIVLGLVRTGVALNASAVPLLTAVLQLASAIMLFQPDATAWFRGKPVDGETTPL